MLYLYCAKSFFESKIEENSINVFLINKNRTYSEGNYKLDYLPLIGGIITHCLKWIGLFYQT